MALIGVNIWYLNTAFSAVSQQPEEAFLSLSTSTLILTDLENTVKNKRVILFFLALLSKLGSWRGEKKEDKDLTLQHAQPTNSQRISYTNCSRKAQFPSSIYRWIPLYISHLVGIVLLPPLSLIQLPSLQLLPALNRRHYPPSMARCIEGTNTDEFGPFAFALCSISHCVSRADEWPNHFDVPVSLVFLSARELLK